MPTAKIALPKTSRLDKLRGVPSPAHRRLFPLAAWLLLCAWLCGLLSPSRVEAVTTTPAKIASWGAGVSASGRLSEQPPANQEGIRVGGLCAYETASGLSEWLSRDPIEERGGINLYGYVGNNPIRNIDLLGTDYGEINTVYPPFGNNQINRAELGRATLYGAIGSGLGAKCPVIGGPFWPAVGYGALTGFFFDLFDQTFIAPHFNPNPAVNSPQLNP